MFGCRCGFKLRNFLPKGRGRPKKRTYTNPPQHCVEFCSPLLFTPVWCNHEIVIRIPAAIASTKRMPPLCVCVCVWRIIFISTRARSYYHHALWFPLLYRYLGEHTQLLVRKHTPRNILFFSWSPLNRLAIIYVPRKYNSRQKNKKRTAWHLPRSHQYLMHFSAQME